MSKKRSDIQREKEMGKKVTPSVSKRKQSRPHPPTNPNAYVIGGYEQASLHDIDRSASATVSVRHRGLRDESSSDNNEDAELFHVSNPYRDPTTGPSHVAPSSTDDVDTDTLASSGTKKTGRGYVRPRSPPRDGMKKKIYMIGGVLVGKDDDELAGFFRSVLRPRIEGCYKQWKDVNRKKREEIWTEFLKVYDCGEYDPSVVYQKFMEQNGEKFRKFVNELKSDVMDGHKDVEELYDVPKPSFIPTDEIWKQYVDHWCSPEHKARSAQNKLNRAKNAGKSNGFGRKGPAVRLLERVKAGKAPSMLAIIKEVNTKKDKNGKETGQYHNESLHEATVEYESVVKEVRPDEVPDQVVLDMNLWEKTEKVAERIKKGRVLGLGTCRQARNLTTVYPDVFGHNAQVQTQLDEMRRQHEEDMAARIRAEQDALKKLEEERVYRQRMEAQMQAMMQAMMHAVPGFVMPSFLSPSICTGSTSHQVPPTQNPQPEDPARDVVVQTQGAPPKSTPE